MTRAEQETILRWDREEQRVVMYTAYSGDAARWQKLGYDVTVEGRDANGEPRGWRATGPAGCVRLRRVKDGAIVKRQGGVPFLRPKRGAEQTISG